MSLEKETSPMRMMKERTTSASAVRVPRVPAVLWAWMMMMMMIPMASWLPTASAIYCYQGINHNFSLDHRTLLGSSDSVRNKYRGGTSDATTSSALFVHFLLLDGRTD